MPKTATEAVSLIDRAEAAGAGLIEIRLDIFRDTEKIAELASHGKAPKIATVISVNCGGKFAGTESQQKQILVDAAKNGFNYVDIKLEMPDVAKLLADIHEHGAKTIVSFHDFNQTPAPAELNDVLEREIACSGDVCKIVTTVKQMEDNLALLNFTATASKKAKVVCFGMGDAGKVSRLLSPLFGGFFTFAALERGAETASGQMAIEEMKAAYRLLGV
jgi:3-dehydroquinate dehydratase type I